MLVNNLQKDITVCLSLHLSSNTAELALSGKHLLNNRTTKQKISEYFTYMKHLNCIILLIHCRKELIIIGLNSSI